jgi:hypothetical protein
VNVIAADTEISQFAVGQGFQFRHSAAETLPGSQPAFEYFEHDDVPFCLIYIANLCALHQKEKCKFCIAAIHVIKQLINRTISELSANDSGKMIACEALVADFLSYLLPDQTITHIK